MFTVRYWIEKAVWTTTDIRPPAGGGWLSPEQVKEFLRVAIEESVLLNQVRSEFPKAPKEEVPRIAFGTRILRAGVEGQRLADADRVKPTTGLVTLDTVLFKGEVPVTDEVIEDNVEGAAVADTIAQMLAKAVGRDLEEIALKSDTARVNTDPGYTPTLDQLDGIVKQLQTGLPTAQRIAAGSISTATELFGKMLSAMPPRYRQRPTDLRFFVSFRTLDAYQAELAQRVTGLGDSAISNQMQTQLAFHGVPVVGVPMLSGQDTVGGTAIDYDGIAILINPMNIIAGYHRQVRIEKFRDPREGVTSYIPTVRFDVKIANPDEAVLATGITLAP